MSDDSQELCEQQLKYCQTILTKLKRNNNAGPFLKPVDPIALNIPDYPEKIKEPMDMSTVKKNLESGNYTSHEAFNKDMTLMFDNCYTYNPSGTVVYDMGKELQKQYEALYSEMPQEVVKKAKTSTATTPVHGSPRTTERQKKGLLGADDVTYCADILGDLEKPKHRKYTWPFMEPVSERDVPGYSTVVTHPMDLGTMRRKLDSRTYGNAKEFDDDLDLVIENCYKFNAPGTEVYGCCEEFEKTVHSLRTKFASPDSRINELRQKISQLTAELREVEKLKANTQRVFSLGERERIGQAILRMSKQQTEKIAEIVQRHCAYEYVDNDEIEVNMNTIPDEVISEMNDYLNKLTEVIE